MIGNVDGWLHCPTMGRDMITYCYVIPGYRVCVLRKVRLPSEIDINSKREEGAKDPWQVTIEPSLRYFI